MSDTRIRPGSPADGPALKRLQSFLPEPSPSTMDAALAGVGVLRVAALCPGSSPAPGDRPHQEDVSVESKEDVSVESKEDGPVESQEDVPVGYVIGVPGDSVAWIAELVVAPRVRGRGLGQALLSACCERLAYDHDRVRLAVAADNERARSLYRSLGFSRVGRSDAVFETSTAVLYERPL